MHKDKDGKISLARSAYIATLASVLFKMVSSDMILKIAGHTIDMGHADLSGMGVILAATALTYYGREKDKNAK